MTEVNFYHLTKTPMERALPQLLLKVIEGNKGVLFCSDNEKLNNINSLLWTFSTNKVVPHGAQEDSFEEDQPVYLSSKEENPNNADILILINGDEPEYIGKFTKCLDIFDGNNNEELEKARGRWKRYSKAKDDVFILTYWKQDEKGNWIKED